MWHAVSAFQYQIATKVDKVYEVELPGSVKQMLNVLSVGVTFGFDGIGMVLQCLDLNGYRAALGFHIIGPLVIAALIAAVGACLTLARSCCNKRSGDKRRDRKLAADDESRSLAAAAWEVPGRVAPALLQLAFLSYPIVATKAFEAFACYEFTASSYLKADVAIECFSEAHTEVKTLAWLAILIYPIG